jgi:hypothetical protein
MACDTDGLAGIGLLAVAAPPAVSWAGTPALTNNTMDINATITVIVW